MIMIMMMNLELETAAREAGPRLSSVITVGRAALQETRFRGSRIEIWGSTWTKHPDPSARIRNHFDFALSCLFGELKCVTAAVTVARSGVWKSELQRLSAAQVYTIKVWMPFSCKFSIACI